MKRDFLLGGTKLPTGGGSKGGWGGHVPPSLYVKRGPEIGYVSLPYGQNGITGLSMTRVY